MDTEKQIESFTIELRAVAYGFQEVKTYKSKEWKKELKSRMQFLDLRLKSLGEE